MTSVPSASDIAPARHEKWELEKAPILFSVSSIRRISVRRKRDWHVVVLAVLDFEHHFDERVERILLQPFEVGCHVIRQAVDALVVGCAFLQEILHAAVLVGQSFLQQRPGLSVGLKMRQTDFSLPPQAAPAECPGCGWKVGNSFPVQSPPGSTPSHIKSRLVFS